MADCNPAQLLQDAVAFSGLSQKETKIAQLVLLKNWLIALDPGADVTPSGILSRASVFSGLSPQQMGIVKLQLLCNIKGA